MRLEAALGGVREFSFFEGPHLHAIEPVVAGWADHNREAKLKQLLREALGVGLLGEGGHLQVDGLGVRSRRSRRCRPCTGRRRSSLGRLSLHAVIEGEVFRGRGG